VPVKARATFTAPIDRFEVVWNGEVVARGELGADRLSATVDAAVKAAGSGWIGVRVFAGRFQAHSSPRFVEVAGKPAGSKADAAYFLAWIDRLDAQLKRRDRVPGDALQKHIADQLSDAREMFRKIAARD
jgi:TolB protein